MPRQRSPAKLPATTRASLPPRMLLAPLIVATFQDLSLSVSTWTRGVWRRLYWEHDLLGFEIEFATQPLRNVYNERCLSRVQRERRAVLGEHAGLHDLFVPVEVAGRVSSILVAGPFAVRHATSADLLTRWFELTRSHGHVNDPAFSRYVRKTLSTLTLEGPLYGAFEKLMRAFAQLASEQGDPLEIARQADSLKTALQGARACERMWSAAQNMLDQRTSQSWSTPLRAGVLPTLGLKGAPGHAVVGLAFETADKADPLDGVLRRAAFQRASVSFALRRGRVVAGRISDSGVVLLADCPGGEARVTSELAELSSKLRALAREFGLRVHAGIGKAQPGESLPLRFRAALAAAEQASRRGAPFAFAEKHLEPSLVSMRRLRMELRTSAEKGSPLGPIFERYIEVVLAHSGYEVDTARPHLDAGLERLLEPLLSNGALDSRSLDELFRTIPDDVRDVPLANLVDAYRHVVTEVESAMAAPGAASHERSIRRALQFMREHLAEPLTLTRVSGVAGFAPDHFSVLLKREQGCSFALHLQSLRLERAKQLLASTSLHMSRVAQLCGFRSRTTFQRLFKQSTGVAPAAYRRRMIRPLASADQRTIAKSQASASC